MKTFFDTVKKVLIPLVFLLWTFSAVSQKESAKRISSAETYENNSPVDDSKMGAYYIGFVVEEELKTNELSFQLNNANLPTDIDSKPLMSLLRWLESQKYEYKTLTDMINAMTEQGLKLDFVQSMLVDDKIRHQLLFVIYFSK